MIRMHRRISSAVTALLLMALVLTGCTSEASNIGNAKEKDGGKDAVDTGFTLSTVGSFDSADTAVVLSTDLKNKAVTFINMDTGKQYTLYYDGTTYIQDKYDGPMTISQIKAGDVVDVTFLKGKKKLASIKLSPEAWVYDAVYNYDLAGANRTASIGSQTYSLPDGVVVLSEGNRMETGEVMAQDVVTISGIDHKIYSVNVDKGHGYLRLKNDQALLGGWIEVGNRVIRQITEDMLLVVPEGSYQVVLSNKNVGCVKDVTVERDKEVVLDVSDLEVAEDAVGKILFTVTPETAKVSVDGKPVDISKVIELPYGIHQVQAEASGYDTLTRHIQVGSEYATISFKLEESRKTDSSVSDNSVTRIPWEDTLDSVNKPTSSVSDNTLSSLSENALGTSNSYKVYIDSPKDVEVYLDGSYIGISPVRFTKTVGSHQITLKKDGYKTKSYTIYLDNNPKDETYSFSALEKEGSTTVADKKIPSEIVEAVSGVTDCRIIDETDVLIAGDLATLQDSGKKMVVTAVKNAVKAKVGEAEAAKYTFTVTNNDNLKSVTAPGEEDGEGIALVTISRDGYESQTVECKIIIEKKKGQEDEDPPAEVLTGKVSFTITPQEAKEKITKFTVDEKDKNPDETIELDYGSHSVHIEAEGYNGFDLNFYVNSEERDPIVCELNVKTPEDVEGDNGEEDPPGTPTEPTNPDPGNTEPDRPSGAGTEGGAGGGGSNDNAGDKGDTDGGNSGDSGETGDGESETLTAERTIINQDAHPIRKFLSSLFK